MSSTEPHYGIRDLVDASGISRRTIRYYVQRELIPPPLGAGRGHYYLPIHLVLLRRILELREQGLSLDAIHVRFSQLRLNDPDAIEGALERLESAEFVGLAPGNATEECDSAAEPAAATRSLEPELKKRGSARGQRATIRVQALAGSTTQIPYQRVTKIGLAPGLELHVADGRQPPSQAQLAQLAAAARSILGNES